MLKKLLKYDVENIFKFLFVFYGLSLFFAVLTRLFLGINDSFIINIIGQVCSGITISMIFNIIINNLLRLWVRFKSNFYGDEAYLTHTLPIEKKTLYFSKALTGVVTLFVSVVVIGITLFIAYYSKENIEMLKNVLLGVANAYGSTVLKILLAFMFVFFLQFANILQAGFSGILLGHKMNNMKMAFSVLYGFGVYMLTQLFALLMIFIVALFNDDMMNLFFTTTVINIDMFKMIIYLAIVIYAISLVGVYLVNSKLFKKGVNVD